MRNFSLKITFLVVLLTTISSCDISAQKKNREKTTNNKNMKLNILTDEEKAVILHKGTERPFIGIYDNFWKTGTYNCKQCNTPLYNSSDKFDGHCGWPAFDDEIEGAVKRIKDADGRRTEIVCSSCGGHLGHIFEGEGFTEKNTRHCVNSISLNFQPMNLNSDTKETAYFAGGCFWGMEYYFQKTKGVLTVESGYMGGKSENPTYREVCTGTSGHYEIVRVNYDSKITNYETLAKLFFEIHDPTQKNGQGPDIGQQYLSVAFYSTEKEKETLEKLVTVLKAKGFAIATKLQKASEFWEAEEYHQDYYEKNGKVPYCHGYTKRF